MSTSNPSLFVEIFNKLKESSSAGEEAAIEAARQEEEVRRVYRLIPPHPSKGQPKKEHRRTENQLIRELSEEKAQKPRLSVRRRINLLADHGLVHMADDRTTVWRTKRLNYSEKGRKESDLYKPMKREIEERWARQPQHNYYPEPRRFQHILINVSGGTGSWNRPDLTLVGGMTLPFLPGKFLDVVTFEVKLWSNQAQRMAAMYEALAHRRWATHSYAVYFSPPDEERKESDVVDITKEAIRTGVGVFIAHQEDDFATWVEHVKPVRHSPDPHLLHERLRNLASKDYELRRHLRRWIAAEPFLDADVREKLSQIEASLVKSNLDLEPGDVTEFYLEIPPAGDAEGYGLPKARPTYAKLAERLGMEEEVGKAIKEALEGANLINFAAKGRKGMERKETTVKVGTGQ